MHRIILSCFLLVQVSFSFSQKKEEGFDFNFRPTTSSPRYYVSTEKKGAEWYREAYYLPERTLAMSAWYKDEKCAIPTGEEFWYFDNRKLYSHGEYANGKKEGLWLAYHENGMIRDSATYAVGHLKGIRLQWSKEGNQVDSSNFDGAGNGTEVTWLEDGTPSSSGSWIADTSKAKRWQYFQANGGLIATEDFINGKRVKLTCFDDAGKALDSAICKEQEATFGNGIDDWQTFMGKTLNGDIPVKKGAPVGQYTVYIEFVVDKDGKVVDLHPKTKFGFGMEQEAMRVIRKSPKWKPAYQYGRKVNAYRRQPITFAVTQG